MQVNTRGNTLNLQTDFNDMAHARGAMNLLHGQTKLTPKSGLSERASGAQLQLAAKPVLTGSPLLSFLLSGRSGISLPRDLRLMELPPRHSGVSPSPSALESNCREVFV